MFRLGCLVAALGLLATNAFAADLALVGAKIYPSPTSPAIEDGVVVVRDGKIAAVGARAKVKVPAGAQVQDLKGAVVTAGFWNSHVHLIAPPLLNAKTLPDPALEGFMDRMFNPWGFTTVFDIASAMSSANDIRGRIAAGKVRGPHILTVGEPFFPDHGTPIYVADLYRTTGLASPEIKDIASATARAEHQIGEGADGVKLFTGAIVGGKIGVLPMPVDQAKALSAVAHKQDRPVFAHPSDQAGLDAAIEGGADILAHSAHDAGPFSPELVARLKARNMALVPTLTLFDVDGRSPGESDESHARYMAVVLQQVKAVKDAGLDILFGTDVGYIDVVDTTTEYRLMGQVMTWREILASLTTTPARRFGKAAETGQVAPGLAADLVVLDADPAKDVTAFAKVRETLRGGVVTWRKAP